MFCPNTPHTSHTQPLTAAGFNFDQMLNINVVSLSLFTDKVCLYLSLCLSLLRQILFFLSLLSSNLYLSVCLSVYHSIGTDMVYLFFSLSFTFCTDKVCLSLSLPEGQGLSCWIICIFILISHQLFSFLSDNKWGEFSLYLWRRALYDISPNISTMPQFILLKYQGRDGRVIWRAI